MLGGGLATAYRFLSCLSGPLMQVLNQQRPDSRVEAER